MMDKASLLTASRVELGTSVRPRSEIIRLTSSTLEVAVRFQNVFGFLCLQTWFLSAVALTAALAAAKVVGFHTYLATKFGAVMSSRVIAGVWDSKTVVTLRRKLFFEFAVFILGGGNMIFMVVFWPGWWVLAGAIYALWLFFG